MTDLIQTRRDQRVLILEMNRPEKKNALTHAMYAAMASAIADAQGDSAIGAVVICAAGDFFTAGNDLADFQAEMPPGKPPVIRFLEAIRDAEKPLFAAVNGPAVGIGLTMLLHCDLSFAAGSATFSAPFTKVGLVPEAASSLLLPQTIGMAMANDILLTGRTINAKEALSCGLISRIYEAESLMGETIKVAHGVCGLAPNSVRLSKSLIRSGRVAVRDQMAMEMKLFMAQLQSDEFAESARAIMEKRLPKFA